MYVLAEQKTRIYVSSGMPILGFTISAVSRCYLIQVLGSKLLRITVMKESLQCTINWIDELFAERIFQLQKGGNGDTCHHPSMLVLQKDPYFLPCRGTLVLWYRVSGLAFFSLNLTLTDRKMQVKFCLKVVMISLLTSKWQDFKLRGLQFHFIKQILLGFCPKFASISFPNLTCILWSVRNK